MPDNNVTIQQANSKLVEFFTKLGFMFVAVLVVAGLGYAGFALYAFCGITALVVFLCAVIPILVAFCSTFLV